MRTPSLLCAVFLFACGCESQFEIEQPAGSPPADHPSPSSPDVGKGLQGAGAPAEVRLANLGPYFPALDLCVGSAGPKGQHVFSSGPAIAALGRPEGIANAHVSAYVPAKTGSIVRVIPAGSPCNPGWGVHTSQDTVIPAPLAASHLAPRFTIVPVPGQNPGEATYRLFVDEPENDQYGIHVRVIQAVPGSSNAPVTVTADDGFGGVETWFDALPYAEPPKHSPLGAVSPNGFLWRPQIQLSNIRAVQNGATLAQQEGDFAVPSGDGNAYGVASVFVSTDGPYALPSVLVCGDNAAGDAGLSACDAQ